MDQYRDSKYLSETYVRIDLNNQTFIDQTDFKQTHTHIPTHTYIYISREREGERERDRYRWMGASIVAQTQLEPPLHENKSHVLQERIQNKAKLLETVYLGEPHGDFHAE